MRYYIIVAHKSYKKIVSQQSYGTSAFLHTWSTKCYDNISIYKIFAVKQDIECYQTLNKWNIVHVESLETTGAQSIQFFDE